MGQKSILQRASLKINGLGKNNLRTAFIWSSATGSPLMAGFQTPNFKFPARDRALILKLLPCAYFSQSWITAVEGSVWIEISFYISYLYIYFGCMKFITLVFPYWGPRDEKCIRFSWGTSQMIQRSQFIRRKAIQT